MCCFFLKYGNTAKGRPTQNNKLSLFHNTLQSQHEEAFLSEEFLWHTCKILIESIYSHASKSHKNSQMFRQLQYTYFILFSFVTPTVAPLFPM